jgi:ABC-type sugar transport system ATPase subunit
MNVLEAEGTGGADGPRVAGEGCAFPLGGRGTRLARGQRVIIGLRPEDVTLATAAGAGAPTTISLVEPMGSTTIVYAPLGGRLLAVEVAKGSELAPGAAVAVAVPAERIHLFDPATERALAA